MSSGEESTAVTLARIEGKLDLLHAAITAAQARGEDHETRIRALESSRIDPEKFAAVEARPVGITPAKLLGACVGVGSVAASLAAVITAIAR